MVTTATKTKKTETSIGTLTCRQKTLKAVLDIVTKALPSRPTHPILGTLKFDFVNGVKVTAFDLSIGIESTIEEASFEGSITSICIDGKLLNDIVSRLPDGDLKIELEPNESEGTSAIVRLGKSRYVVGCQDADDYPEIARSNEGSFEIESATLKQLLSARSFTSGDESKQILTGVRLKLGSESAIAYATDGHRAARVPVDVSGLPEMEVTIPGKAAIEVAAVMKDAVAEIEWDYSQMSIHCGQTRVTTRLLEGQYPNVEQLMPKQFNRVATVERQALIQVLERLAIVADHYSNIVALSIGTEEINFDVKGQGEESIACELKGEDLRVSFNVKYLLDILKFLPGESVEIRMNTNVSPVVFGCQDSAAKVLVMPVQERN